MTARSVDPLPFLISQTHPPVMLFCPSSGQPQRPQQEAQIRQRQPALR